MDRTAIAKLIKAANRSELARNTGIHLSHISKVLSGHRRPSADKLQMIAVELGLSMSDLHNYLLWLRSKVNKRAKRTAA